jgi:hypothetical protein
MTHDLAHITRPRATIPVEEKIWRPQYTPISIGVIIWTYAKQLHNVERVLFANDLEMEKI